MPRSFRIILGGFVLLALFLWIGRAQGGPRGGAKAALAFIVVWFAAAAANMTIGVVSAGYTIAEELPILLLIFLPPAAAAFYYWRKWR